MSTTSPALTLACVNLLERDQFVRALGGVFEHSPWVAAAAWPAAPFADVAALHQAMAAAVREAPAARQLDLIRAHPDLAGPAARSGTMTAQSTAEQGGAGLLSLDDAEYQCFQRLNTAYRERFGFPFIIAVRHHDKASLLAAFAARLANPPGAEIETALGEIFTITRIRLDAMFGVDEPWVS